jgi:hypothetical protein
MVDWKNVKKKAAVAAKGVGNAINKAPAKYQGFQEKVKITRDVGRGNKKGTPSYYDELLKVMAAGAQRDPNSTYGIMFGKYKTYIASTSMSRDDAIQRAHDETLAELAQKRTIGSRAKNSYKKVKSTSRQDIKNAVKDKLSDAKKTASATKDASAEDFKQAGLSWPAAVSGAGSKIKYRMYEAVFYIIGGIFALFLPNFLGLGAINLFWLSMALIFCMPAYTLFWSESDIKRKLAEAGDEDEIGASVALLMPKAMAKIAAFVLIIWNFTMINLLLALATAFVFYFSLKASYKSNQPYRMIESFARMGFGLWIAFLLMTTFNSVPQVGLSLAIMAVAFFFVLPINKDAASGPSAQGTVVVSLKDKISNFRGSAADKIIFFVLMLISLLMAFMGNPTGGLFGTSQTIFFVVWLLSLIMGYSAGPEGRPAIGILMIFVALFAFSGMYTGVVGQAVFGYWWPQVESFGETFLGPLNEAWAQAQSGMGDAWLMMTNPVAYSLQMQQRQLAVKSVVQEGGSVLSIENTMFNLMPSIPGTLEPTEPIIGTLEFTNSGEYESDYLQLDVYASFKDSKTQNSKSTVVGTFKGDTISCGGGAASVLGKIATCIWEGTYDTSDELYPIYREETKMANFIYVQDGWKDTSNQVDLSKIKEVDVDANPVDPASEETQIDTYEYAGQSVKVNANITYKYRVNVSIPIEVIDSETYLKLVQNRQIQLIDLTSQYTGGPVKATLNSQRQPLRAGDSTEYIMIANIYNDGLGIIKSIEGFTIKIPSSLTLVPGSIVTTFAGSSTVDGCGDSVTSGGYTTITCSHNSANTAPKFYIKHGEFKRVSFFVTANPLDSDVERKTDLMIGNAAYTYMKTNTQTLTISNGPPQ